MTEIKPCPFCGGEAEVVEYPGGKSKTHPKRKFLSRFIVRCCQSEVCEVNPWTSLHFTAEEAIEAWNRRISNE